MPSDSAQATREKESHETLPCFPVPLSKFHDLIDISSSFCLPTVFSSSPCLSLLFSCNCAFLQASYCIVMVN